MATRGQLKRRKENPGEAAAAAATDMVRRGRNARNYKRLKADKKAQSQVRASVGEQAGRRAAKRMDSPRGKLQARRRQAGENLRKLSAAIKPSKTGVESYKSFMGG